MMQGPPRLAEWLLTRSLGETDRHAVIGDLYEEFAARAMHQGHTAARRWYWHQTVRSLWPNLLRRRRHQAIAINTRGGSPMLSTWTDLRFGWRMVRRRPLVTAVAVISLVVAMTAATVVFGLLNAVSLRSLPVERASDLALILEQRAASVNRNFPYQDFIDFRSAQQSLSDLATYAPVRPAVTLASGSEPLAGELVSGNYFSMLGIRMRFGRGLSIADEDRSSAPVIVVNEALWRRLGGASNRFDARTLVLNGEPFAIVGVAAFPFRGMQVGRDAQFWAPVHQQRVLEPANGLDFTTRPSVSWLTLMGRRRDGVSLAQVAQDLNRVEAGLPRLANRPQVRRLIAVPGHQGDSMLPVAAAAPLQMLLVATGLLMIVACANVAGLQLTRTAERDRELSVRAALGASRRQLAGLLLAEAVILGAAAMLLTAGASLMLTRLAVPLLDLDGSAIALDVSPDWRVWGFVASLGVVATMFFGAVPMATASRRRSLAVSLADGFRIASPGGRRALLRRGLVVTQFAVALGLAACSILFLRTMHHLRALPTGFDLDHIAVLEVDPAAATGGTPAPARMAKYIEDAAAALAAVPGVRAVGFARVRPLDFGGMRSSIEVPGYTPAPGEDMELNLNRVTPGYFAAMGLSAIDGRLFDSRDVRGAAPVAIVNETMARHFWSASRAVGQTVMLGNQALVVAGVVPDITYRQLREPRGPSFYVSALQSTVSGGAFHVRTYGPADRLVETLRRTLANVDSAVPVSRARDLRAQADLHVTKERLAMTITVVLASAALLLAAVGLYGAMSHAVGQRTREIGVRVALGAVPRDVRRLVLRQGLVLCLLGSIAGIALAIWLGGLIEHLLFGVQPADVVSLAASVLVLAAIAVVATWVPARRAMRIDPVTALRE